MLNTMRTYLLVCGLIFALESGRNLGVVVGFGIVGKGRISSPSGEAAPLLKASSKDENNEAGAPRREFLSRIGINTMAGLATVMATVPFNNSNNVALAAPPIAVIAEELGYFPVQNKAGDLVYVPKRVQRESSDQAVTLAKKLSDKGAVMYGAYWCPHCARQKELLGREAMKYITYVECSPKGYGAQPLMCNKKDIDGYPSWSFRDKSVLGGERPLEDLAKQVNLAAFDPQLEQNVPPPLGSNSCK